MLTVTLGLHHGTPCFWSRRWIGISIKDTDIMSGRLLKIWTKKSSKGFFLWITFPLQMSCAIEIYHKSALSYISDRNSSEFLVTSDGKTCLLHLIINSALNKMIFTFLKIKFFDAEWVWGDIFHEYGDHVWQLNAPHISVWRNVLKFWNIPWKFD